MAKTFWDKSAPFAIAHRGGDGAGGDKENTLEAFQTAWDLGYKYAETDVILAATGEIVVIHGARNWIQAGVSRSLSRNTLQLMTLEQMRQIVRPGGAKVPTLEEVLSTFPEMKFMLDLKTDEVSEPLAKLLKKLKALDRVCITGFNYRRNTNCIERCGVGKVSGGLTVGRGARFRNINMFLLKSGKLTGVEAIFLHHSLVSPPMINLIHRRGFKAIVWTANSSLGIKHAIRSGADGIISDRVTLLKRIIESKQS
jgi:glycerophosphoryl diester phosphodiesterase